MHNDILSGMFDCIERLAPDTKVQDKITKEISSYKNAAGDFGRKIAIRTQDTLLLGKDLIFSLLSFSEICLHFTRILNIR